MKEFVELDQNLSKDLKTTLVNFRAMIGGTSDLVTKYANIAGCDICIITCEAMINTATISTLVFPPLVALDNSAGDSKLQPDELMEKIQNKLLIAVEQNQPKTYEELALVFMSGFAIILVDGVDSAVAIGVQGFNTRGIERPLIHSDMRGACEGFCEVLRFNISLVRRRIRSTNFVTKITTIGDYSKTDIAICYFKDKVDKDMLREIEERLQKIPVNMILESGYIEPFLQEKGNSIFSQVGITDRPDYLAAKLYDGRVGVMVEGTPYVMFLPLLFTEHFQTMDDYSGLSIYANLTRWLKYFSLFITFLLPGLFVAISSFNPELFPPTILFNIISAEQKTPFTILAECLLVIIIYEIMKEAGLRLPSVVGHAVSIVGGLVLGDIVISVGLVSAPLVLIVALSAITSFIVPDLYPTIVILRLAFVIAGGLFGLFGITVLGIAVLFKMCAMSSYGVPYMAPLTPYTRRAMRDYFVRRDWRKLAQSDITLSEMTGVKNR